MPKRESRCGLGSSTYKGVGGSWAASEVRCVPVWCVRVCVCVWCVKGYRVDITLPGANHLRTANGQIKLMQARGGKRDAFWPGLGLAGFRITPP